MIFNTNTTSLSNNIPMAEGYDGSIGAALALVESARNDYSMFRAMLDIDARECQLMRESTGYVNESELQVLQEGTISGIWNKIKELFKKLIAKIKAIFHVFISKMESLWKTDKQMVKKYEKELYRKTNIGNLEVDWITFKPNTTAVIEAIEDYDSEACVTEWKEDADEREKYYNPHNFESDSFEEDMDDEYLDGGEPEKKEIKEIGGIRSICTFLNEYNKAFKDLDKECNKLNKRADDVIKKVDKFAKDVATSYSKTGQTNEDKYLSRKIATSSTDTRYASVTTNKDDADNTKDKLIKATDTEMKNANKSYDMAVAYQNAVLRTTRWVLDATKRIYKQYKSAFMKAIAANDKKLEESAIYAQAVAEAAEQEVEEVIAGALSKEQLSDICNAPLDVMGSGVSDDPNKLTYSPDTYYPDMSEVDTDGYVDNDINGSHTSIKSETAFFGQLLY